MRPIGKVQINVSVDREAIELVKLWAAHPRGYGDLLTRLVFEERARREERQRIARRLEEAVLGAGDAA
jgi:hypothetical protein